MKIVWMRCDMISSPKEQWYFKISREKVYPNPIEAKNKDEKQLNLWGEHLLKKLTEKNTILEGKLYIRFLYRISQRLAQEQDAVIVVTGATGSGKTSFAINS